MSLCLALLVSLVSAQSAVYLFNPCRVVDPSVCWFDDFTLGNGVLDPAKYTQVAQQGADQAPGSTVPRWLHTPGGGFQNGSGEVRGDQNRVMGRAIDCAESRGSIFQLKQATLSAVNPKSRFIRVKFKFNNPTDRCAGVVFGYNTPNDFFLASVCRQNPTPPEAPCLKVRQYYLGAWTQLASPTIANNFTQSIPSGVWLELELVMTTGGSNTFGITFANQPISGATPFTIPTGNTQWYGRTDNQIGLWSSFADVSWDDASVADNAQASALEYVHRVCRSTSCPAPGPGSNNWCRCCFFDCFAPALGRGEKEQCIANGFCGRLSCNTTTFCPATPAPPMTPPPTPAPTPAPPTPAPPQAPRSAPYARSCPDASRFLNPDGNAGALCNSCNKYALSGNSSENCNWCDNGPSGFSYCLTAAELVTQCTGARSVIVRNEADCPNPCSPAPVQAFCAIPSGRTVPTTALCSLVNNVTYSESVCYAAAMRDSQACLRAVRRYDCTRECQACRPELVSTTRGFLLPPCKSVCDDIRTLCPTAASTCLSARPCAASATALCTATVPLVGETLAPTPVPSVNPNDPCGSDQDGDGVTDCEDQELNVTRVAGAAYVPVWDGVLSALVAFDAAPTGLTSRGVQRLRVRSASTSTSASSSFDVDALNAAGSVVEVTGLQAAEALTVCIRPTAAQTAASIASLCLAVFNPTTFEFVCEPGALSLGTARRTGTVCGQTTHLSRFALAPLATTTLATTTAATVTAPATTTVDAGTTTTPAPTTADPNATPAPATTRDPSATTAPTAETTTASGPATTADPNAPTTPSTTAGGVTPSTAAPTTVSGSAVVAEPAGLSEGGVIAIAVVFSLLGVALLALAVFCLVKNRRANKSKGDDLGSREMTDKVVPKDEGTDKVYDNADDESESGDKKKPKPAAAAAAAATTKPTPTTAAEAKKPAAAAAAETKKADEPKKSDVSETKKADAAEAKKPETKKVAVKEESESSSGGSQEEESGEYSYEDEDEEDVKPPPSRKPPAPEPGTEVKKEAAPALPSSPSPAAAGADTSSESDLFGDEESGSLESGSYSESESK